MSKLLMLLLLLAVPSVLFAADQHEPTTYVIKQGDTLWGLSERFIKDPKYWPNMWSKNGQVTNPHFIYPGQKLRIFPDRLEFVPKAKETLSAQKSSSAKTPPETLQDVVAEKTYTLYGTEGFLAEKDFKPYGLIVGTQHDRVVVGVDEIVYTNIGSSKNASGGDKFSIFFKDILVKHPITNNEMGNKIIPLGTLQLTDVDLKSSRAIITKSFREISPGAYLVPYRENHRREIELKANTSDLKGYIIESYNGANLIATGDIVYVDLGSANGVVVGNMLYIVRDVLLDQMRIKGNRDKLPQELLGAIVILETGNKTSTALVVKSIETLYKGDRVVSQTK